MPNLKYELGDLADPSKYCSPIDTFGFELDEIIAMYRSMVLIRYAEEAIANLVIEGFAKAPCHLAIGQEAIPVGISTALNKNDKVFGNHRSHGHFLALGCEVRSLMCEVLGKVEGCSRGMGGSMHLYGESFGFIGSVPIVGATIPLAVGAGLALQLKAEGGVAVAYFGDGAMEEGVIHECLNFASVNKIPVLFVCENNLFSSHMDIHLRQPSNLVSRIAEAHLVNNRVIDGNDVTAVARVANEMIENIRNGSGPGFIEAITYRWLGHVGPNEDLDVGVRRSEAELHQWKKRDPIARLRHSIVADRGFSNDQLEEIDRAINSEIAESVIFAKGSQYPDVKNLEKYVYAEYK